MNVSTWVVIVAVAGCAVEPTTSAVSEVRRHDSFTVTGAGTSLLQTNYPATDEPFVAHMLTTGEYVYDGNLLFVAVDGMEQDPTSYTCGPEACFYAAGYFYYGFGVVPRGDSAVTSTRGWIRTTLPANSDVFWSERCVFDHRDGSRSCTTLEGMPVSIDWEAYGELSVSAGIERLDFGPFELRLAGRYTFTPSYATGMLLDRAMANVDGYITNDRGAGVLLEVLH